MDLFAPTLEFRPFGSFSLICIRSDKAAALIENLILWHSLSLTDSSPEAYFLDVCSHGAGVYTLISMDHTQVTSSKSSWPDQTMRGAGVEIDDWGSYCSREMVIWGFYLPISCASH